MNTIIRNLLIFIIVLAILFAAWPISQGNLDFHTDIARDFLLLEDVYYNQNITLLGPRSGGIPGVFHGPLWIYLNLPAFIIGGGNPTAVGWFWLLLFAAGIGVVYWIGKKLVDNTTGLLAAAVFATAFAGNVYAMFNPFGAVLLFPVYFYYFNLYAKKLRFLDLVISFFVLGLIIQFQMAFGGPILILSVLYLAWIWITEKKWSHIFAPFILVVPLASYIVFELRNNFLQFNSVLNYVSGKENLGKVEKPFLDLLQSRISYMFFDTIGVISQNTFWISFLVFAVIFVVLTKNIKLKKDNIYLLFGFFLGGFWFLTLFYQGVIWGYYYVPFLGMTAIIFASGYKQFQKSFLLILILLLLQNSYNTFVKFSTQNPQDGTWRFFRTVAEETYKKAPAEFGYYIYSRDLYGYSARYAMNYTDRKNMEKTGIPFEKREHTFLLIDDPDKNLNDWKTYDIGITKDPGEVVKPKENYFIEHYVLTSEEQAVQSNPNLIQTLIFR